jgi:hypothetical protein
MIGGTFFIYATKAYIGKVQTLLKKMPVTIQNAGNRARDRVSVPCNNSK